MPWAFLARQCYRRTRHCCQLIGGCKRLPWKAVSPEAEMTNKFPYVVKMNFIYQYLQQCAFELACLSDQVEKAIILQIRDRLVSQKSLITIIIMFY